MKTSELIGPVLDWAVATLQNVELDDHHRGIWWNSDDDRVLYHPSTEYAQGGPIIEREWISVFSPMGEPTSDWCAKRGRKHAWGATPLIAAMRCYVASKLGDEVDVPKDLAS